MLKDIFAVVIKKIQIYIQYGYFQIAIIGLLEIGLLI